MFYNSETPTPLEPEERMYTYNNDGVTRMKSDGQAKIQIIDGDGRVDESNAKWGLTYNNDEYGNGGVDGVVESTKNGEKHVYQIQIPNDELYKIFSAPPQRGSLDNRLRKDFSMTSNHRMTSNRHRKHLNPVKFTEPMFETIFEPAEQGYQGDISESDEMGELLRMIRQGTKRSPQRTRRIRINYSSGPARHSSNRSNSDRSSSSHNQRTPRRARPHMGRRQTNKFKRMTPKRMTPKRMTLKRSSKSNLPLTEIND
jgi:hypothetical protein